MIGLHKNKGNRNNWATEKRLKSLLFTFLFWKRDMLHSTALTQPQSYKSKCSMQTKAFCCFLLLDGLLWYLVDVPLRINCNSFGDSVTLHLVPLSGSNSLSLFIISKILKCWTLFLLNNNVITLELWGSYLKEVLSCL